ncbi:MAG: AraC family transcriptional regulator [Kiritimatiellae bacterium]|nr:AraC family transcriptional regulator [Kiritimatiellia bacterium]
MTDSSWPIIVESAAYKEAGPHYRASPHVRHHSYQWYAVLYGRVEATVDGTRYVLGAEQSVLVPPSASRSFECRGRAPGYLYVHFTNRRLQLDALPGRRLAIPPLLRPDLHALADELRGAPGLNSADHLLALIVRILIGTARQGAEASPPAEPLLSPLNAKYHQMLVARAETFMRRNMHRRLSRREIAAAVRLSPAHLARVFRATTGDTPAGRLTALRMERARRLLLDSTLSVTEIALEVGYASFSHFSKTFRQTTRVAPSDYRRSSGHTWRGK